MYTSYQYTKNVGSLFQHSVSQAKTFYCREDFDTVIKRYKKAPADSKEFIKKELDDMCKPRGLDSLILLRNPKALESIPNRRELLEQLQDHFVETFFNLHSNLPSAHDYMKRIVHQLAPEYKNDSVRVAILKKFVLGAGVDCDVYDISSIIEWAVDRMDDSEKNLYKTALKQTQLEMVVEKLDDSIFDKSLRSLEFTWEDILHLIQKRDEQLYGTKVINSAGKEMDYPAYLIDPALMVKDASKEVAKKTSKQSIQDVKEAAIKICEFYRLDRLGQISVCALYEALHRNMQDEQELETCQLSDPPSEEEHYAFLELVEKGFRRHLNQFSYRTKKGSTAKLVDKYKDDRKYAKEQKQTGNWTLLTLCEDFAQGAFKTNNRQTRVNLYRFAIMFNMTFAIENRIPETDIEKNLFEDYYCDNLVRFLGQSPLDLKESSGWEKEPSGEGINLKNYVEAIYIYYLCRKDLDLTPGQRIMRAEAIIQECKRSSTTTEVQIPSNAYTQYYAEKFTDVIMNASEEALPGLILANYRVHGAGATPIQKESQQISASEFIGDSLRFLGEGREDDYAIDEEAELRQEQIDEIAEMTLVSFDWKLGTLLRERYSNNEDFIRVLNQLDSRLTEEFDWISGREKAVLALTLQALYHNTSSTSPIKLKKLKDIVQESDPSIDQSSIIESAVRTLCDLGFDVHKLSGNEESVICWKAIAPILQAYESFSNVARLEAIPTTMTQEANKCGQEAFLKYIDAERINTYATQLADKKVITLAGSSDEPLICWNPSNSGNLMNTIPFEESLNYLIAVKLFDELNAIDRGQNQRYQENSDVRKVIKKLFPGEFHCILRDDLVQLIQEQLPSVAQHNIVACITSLAESGCLVLKTVKYNQYICWSAPFENNHALALSIMKDEEDSFSELFYEALQSASDACSVIVSPKNKTIVDALLKCESNQSSIRLTALLHELRKTEPLANEDNVISRVNRLKVLGMPINIQGNYETLICWESDWNDREIGDIFPNEFVQQQNLINWLVHCLQAIRKDTSTRIISVDYKTLYAMLQQEIPDVEAYQLFEGLDYLIATGLQARIDEETIIWERSYYDDMTFKAASERLIENAPSEKAFKENLLKAMRACADGCYAVRVSKLAEYFSEKGKEGNAGKILDAAKKLVVPGSGICKLGSDDSLLYLGARKYPSDKLNRTIKKIETLYKPDIAGLRQMFTEMLADREPADRTITRTTVLSVCLSHYVDMLLETDGINSFQDLYEDFAAYANTYLEDCRFQRLHEKNILDMYIILSLFFYATENGIK